MITSLRIKWPFYLPTKVPVNSTGHLIWRFFNFTSHTPLIIPPEAPWWRANEISTRSFNSGSIRKGPIPCSNTASRTHNHLYTKMPIWSTRMNYISHLLNTKVKNKMIFRFHNCTNNVNIRSKQTIKWSDAAVLGVPISNETRNFNTDSVNDEK